MLSCLRSNLLLLFKSSSAPSLRSHLRLTSSISASSESVAESPATLSFDEIPGPRGLPLIGNVWRYLPVIGEFQLEKLDDIGRILNARFGPIVREHVFGNLNIVHLFDPVDMEVMFRNEGRYPERRSHRALGKYRTDRKDLYSSGGIFCESVYFSFSFLSPLTSNMYLFTSIISFFYSWKKIFQKQQKPFSSKHTTGSPGRREMCFSCFSFPFHRQLPQNELRAGVMRWKKMSS